MGAHAKDLKDLRKFAKKHGIHTEITGGCHIKWISPSGAFFFSALTPGDFRVIKKIKNNVKKLIEGRPIRF